MKQLWSVVADGNKAKIMLYGAVGDGDAVDSARVVSELSALAATHESIEVRINSKGGDVFSGIAIYNALKSSPANITIYIDGLAASIAAIIALCGKPLYMSRHARLMLHEVSAGEYGSAATLRRTAEMVERLQIELATMIADRLKKTPEEINATYFDGVDHWMTAQEAFELHLIDGIYDMTTAAPPTTTEEIYQFTNRLIADNTNNMLYEELIKTPAFAGKSETEVLAMINEHANSATLVDSLKKANEQYKKKIADLEEKEITAVLNQAVSEGKITKEQLPSFKALMATDRENTEALLATMVTRGPLVKDYMVEGASTGNKLANMSWDDLDRAGKLNELRLTDPATFAQKYKERFGVEYED